jgi:hypothetical protein
MYLHFSDRRRLQTRAYFGFSHRTAYLAVSYMDRFCLHRCMDVRQLSVIRTIDSLVTPPIN